MFPVSRSGLDSARPSPRARWAVGILAVGGALFCSPAPAGAAEINAAELRAAVTSITTEGELCAPGSVATALSEDGATATVLFSQPVAGVVTVGCRVTLELEVPEGLSLGLPMTAIRGFTSGDGAIVSRSLSFDGVGGAQELSESVNEDFVLVSGAADPRSPTCGGARRATYVVDISADVLGEDTFFQIDSLDVDTSFRFGTSWASCDPGDPLEVSPSAPGEFCDGPNQQPCAEGLQCDRETAPQNAEGTCFTP